MITKEQALAARLGTIFHHKHHRDSRGRPAKYRISGKCQTWKTRPKEFRLPVKYGLYHSTAITHENAHFWDIAEEG